MQHDRKERDSRPVLVVEDSDDDFDTVVEAAIRGKVSNRLIRAADADEARSLLARNGAGSFAFMLLDENLPGLDGLALLKIVRRDPALNELPAVVYTSSVNPRDREAFLQAGADALYAKSVAHTSCLSTLEFIFEHWLDGAVPTDAEMPARTREAERRCAS